MHHSPFFFFWLLPPCSSVEVFLLVSVHSSSGVSQALPTVATLGNKLSCTFCYASDKCTQRNNCSFVLENEMVSCWGNQVQCCKIFICCWYVPLHMAPVTWLLGGRIFSSVLLAVTLKESFVYLRVEVRITEVVFLVVTWCVYSTENTNRLKLSVNPLNRKHTMSHTVIFMLIYQCSLTVSGKLLKLPSGWVTPKVYVFLLILQ